MGGTSHEYQIDVVTERALAAFIAMLQAESEFLAESQGDASAPQAIKSRSAKKGNKCAAATLEGKSSKKVNRN
jgi:hypothetical protein